MYRTALLSAVLLAFTAGSAGAQEHLWTADRPDGVAPPGVYADRTLGVGTFEITAQYQQLDLLGVRFGSELITNDQTFDLFQIAPLEQVSELLEVRAAYGLTEQLTLFARSGFVQKTRDQITEEDFFILESSALADTEVHLLWEAFRSGPVRAQLQGGVLIPTGSVDEEDGITGVRSGILPYDMQTGAGVFGILPGIAISMQNEVGTVGAQVIGRIYSGENDRGWRPGNAVEANGWASYRANDYISITARVRATGWAEIEGFDPALDPFRDPGELASSFGGERVDVPIGLAFYMPRGMLAGHRLSFEWISNVHEETDGPWLASDNGFVVSWQAAFGG